MSIIWLSNQRGVLLPSTSRSRAAVARRAHNPKVGGSIPPFATNRNEGPQTGPFLLGCGMRGDFLSLPRSDIMKVGFVSIFGKPNAGKSTLLNALMGEKLAIVSPKVQTTRHRIKGISDGRRTIRSFFPILPASSSRGTSCTKR